MNAGVAAGVAGCLIGIVGGILGTYLGIRDARSPRERRYVIRCAVAVWIAVALLLGALMLLPHPYTAYIWVPYAVLLFLGIRGINRGQARIRAEDAG